MKLSLLHRRAVEPAADRHARRLDAQRRAGAVRRDDLRRRRTPRRSCSPPTWRSACACRCTPRSRAPAAPCSRRGCCSTSRARCRPTELTLELRSAEQDVELICGADDLPPAHAARRGLPDAARARRRRRASTLPARRRSCETISRVARSASRDETRPVLTGILMSASGQELRMVATDSYRLSVKETALEAPLQGSLEANVPARALQELVRIAQQRAARVARRQRRAEPGRLRARRRSCSPRA